MSKITDIYAPGNRLSEKEKAEMHDLTDDQIEELAAAYPNQARGNAYLVYYMKNEKPQEQRYPLGTWPNLKNLRKLGQKHIVAHDFAKNFHAPKRGTQSAPVQKRVVDLSAKDVEKAEGLKKVKAPEVTKAFEVVQNEANPTELEVLEFELKELQDAKAHHMTIKAVQNKIDALKEGEVEAKEAEQAATKVDLSSL